VSRSTRLDKAILRDPTQPASRIYSAHLSFVGAVAALGSLDPLLVELVRLRCARTHDCRACQAIRYGTALAAGGGEETYAKVDEYEHSDLDEWIKVALRITDAYINSPGDIGPELVAQASEHFSPAELVELLLQIAKNSTQKIGVSLGTDANSHPVDERGLTIVASPGLS
jgi:alkylhydroperoxidase family enzyme